MNRDITKMARVYCVCTSGSIKLCTFNPSLCLNGTVSYVSMQSFSFQSFHTHFSCPLLFLRFFSNTQ